MNQNVPERTLCVLNLGSNCLLTLTNKHLRGQILRVVDGKSRKTIRDQVDVLLSGIAGYTIVHESNYAKRIASVILGIVVFFGYCLYGASRSLIYQQSSVIFGLVIGAIVAVIGCLWNHDNYAFSLNIMGSNTMIPVVYSQTPEVQRFITKLQNAKIAYDEM